MDSLTTAAARMLGRKAKGHPKTLSDAERDRRRLHIEAINDRKRKRKLALVS